jgi:phosphoribosyl 1,2-cyclic phosphodiesterase
VALTHSDSPVDGPTLLLDAGTGLRALGPLLGDQPFRGTILLSHLHWDHIQGIPFFDRGDRNDAHVAVLVPPQDDGTDGETVLARMMSPPLFPIWPKDLRGRWTFGDLPSAALADGVVVEGFTVVARDVPHKGGRTLGYRVSDDHSTVVYIPDHCPTVLGPGEHQWGELHENALELARSADLLIHDAHLRADEVAAEGFFGHAAADYAVELARKAGASQVALFHHRPDRTDDEVDAMVAGLTTDELPVVGAAEGSGITL